MSCVWIWLLLAPDWQIPLICAVLSSSGGIFWDCKWLYWVGSADPIKTSWTPSTKVNTKQRCLCSLPACVCVQMRVREREAAHVAHEAQIQYSQSPMQTRPASLCFFMRWHKTYTGYHMPACPLFVLPRKQDIHTERKAELTIVPEKKEKSLLHCAEVNRSLLICHPFC